LVEAIDKFTNQSSIGGRYITGECEIKTNESNSNKHTEPQRSYSMFIIVTNTQLCVGLAHVVHDKQGPRFTSTTAITKRAVLSFTMMAKLPWKTTSKYWTNSPQALYL